MTLPVFERFLATPDIGAVFADASVMQGLFRFEAALARAQAAEGLIPPAAAATIASMCRAELYDLEAIAAASGRAGSLAIPLVDELRRTVGLVDADAARWVHFGSTSQDAIDTGMALVTRDALALLDRTLARVNDALFKLAEVHADTPVLARTLMQPAQATSFGLKCANWLAPLLRARARLREQGALALALQLGGAVGTLSVIGERAPQVAQRMAAELGLAAPASPWHAQRDEWVRLGLEAAVLVGSLGKLATDLALMAQGEIAELAEPTAAGRGGSTAMPHKRNPVAAMAALAAAHRTPHRAAALLAAMPQQHERGLGNWQAELAEWPGLWISAHGAARAMAEAMEGLQVDAPRMRRNLGVLDGAVYADASALDAAARQAAVLARTQLAVLRAGTLPPACWPDADAESST